MPAIWRYGLVLTVTALTFFYEAWGSYATNSKGILSDATHMLGDGIPFVLGFIASRKATSAARKAALEEKIRRFNFIFLAATAAIMCATGLYRLLFPVAIASEVLHFALIGIVGNAAQLLLAHGFERSQRLHLLVDLLSSVSVVLAEALVVIYGWPRADSIVTIIVAGFTAWAAYECGHKAHTHAGHHHGHTH